MTRHQQDWRGVVRDPRAAAAQQGLAATRIIEAVLKNEHRVLPVSSRLDDYYGIGDVCLSVPSLVDRRGVPDVIKVPLSDDELAGLRASAQSMSEVQRRFGL